MIVASCGTILIDVLRSQLLVGSEGLPLGILASQQRFKDLSYLISPEFRLGLAGFSSRWRRAGFALLLLAMALISIFAGPAAATLMVPTLRTGWGAGGASFWLKNDNDSLWPSELTAASIGGSHCQSPTVELLSNNPINMSGCIWSGYSLLEQAYKEAHLNDEIDLELEDGMIRWDMTINEKGWVAETWAMTSHLTIGMFTENIGTVGWYDALLSIPSSSLLHGLQYQERNETMAFVDSWVPVVRTSCNCYYPAFFNDSGETFDVCTPASEVGCRSASYGSDKCHYSIQNFPNTIPKSTHHTGL